jgi:hypothetical protein
MPFDVKQTSDVTQSILFDYPNMTVSSISNNGGSFFSGNLTGGGSNPNITYTKSNFTTKYSVNQIRIYGVIFPNLVSTIPHNGTLIISNTPVKKDQQQPTVYMCFLLGATNSILPTDVDNLITSTPNATPSIFLNNIIKPTTGSNKYVIFSGKDKNSNPTTVVIYTSPVMINLSNIPYTSTTSDWIVDVNPQVYSMVDSAESAGGEWMECDYAPMDSDEAITTYNIPIQSSLIKDSNVLDSFRTLIMFMVFLLLCIFAYLIIPSIYLAVITKLLGSGLISGAEKKTLILYIDIAISAAFGITGLVLLCVGAFSDPDVVPNTSDILLSGFIISIVFIISYVVVQSKKLTGKFIEGVKYDYI